MIGHFQVKESFTILVVSNKPNISDDTTGKITYNDRGGHKKAEKNCPYHKLQRQHYQRSQLGNHLKCFSLAPIAKTTGGR